MIRRLLVGTVLSGLLATLTACGDDSPAQSPLNNGPVNKQGGGTKYQPGVEAKSLKCDTFTAAVQSAAREVVPTIEVKVNEDFTEVPDGLNCGWNIAPSGSENESAIVAMKIEDAWDRSALTGDDGEFTYQADSYESYRKNAEEVNNGKSENNAPKHTYKPSEGVGKAAFVTHTEAPYASGDPGDFNIDIDILRDRRPYKVGLEIVYSVSSDKEAAGGGLDKAMRDEGDRQRLVESIARSLLAKIG